MTFSSRSGHRQPLDGRTLLECPVGLVPLGWPDPTDDPDGVLAEIAGLGYEGVQYGSPGPEPQTVVARFDRHGIGFAERYFAIRCTPDGPAQDSLDEAESLLRELRTVGGRNMVAALDGSPDRDRHAGRASRAPRLSPAGWDRLTELLEQVARRAADSDVLVSFHPHAGTYVETPAESQRLLEGCDPSLVGLCLDTGHWLVGGGDPVAAIGTYGARVTHVHLKDVDPAVLVRLPSGDIATLTEAVDHRIFCPLGDGLLDLDGVLRALARVDYRGWLMIEQDSFHGTAAEAAASSRQALAARLAELTGTVDTPSP
jgi:inosose dehydratase